MLQSGWSGLICLVLPVAVWVVCLVWFDLLGTAFCSLFGLVWFAWYGLLQSGWSVWSGPTWLLLSDWPGLACLALLDTV